MEKNKFYTREKVIGGVKYIMICADENVEVNGVSIHIGESEQDPSPATV